MVKGCTEGVHVDAAALAATDGFMRAVWVDRDCSAAERFMGSPATDSADWCRSERTVWTRRNFFLVQHSRHVVGDCRPSQLFDLYAASPECIQYKLVGRTAAGCRNVTSARNSSAGCAGGHAHRYTFATLDLVVAKRHGRWKVFAFFQDTGTECYPDAGCRAIMRDWEQRVPLHSRGPV